jgi:hypothetical protein
LQETARAPIDRGNRAAHQIGIAFLRLQQQAHSIEVGALAAQPAELG